MRDSQRSRVYRAEDALFSDPDMKKPVGGGDLRLVEAYIYAVLDSKAVAKRWPLAAHGRPTIRPGRGARWARGGTSRITLPRWARTKPVILHELAHFILKTEYLTETIMPAAHGREFAGIYLELVRLFLGSATAEKLQRAYKEQRIKYRARRRLTPERLAQLREHGKRLALLAARRRDS